MPLIPKRFYAYLILDVLKQFAITALILVVVIAFGAAIKPLSSDQLLSGWDTLKYLLLALVPMLQFAIPFSAAFATTLVLHRMSQDNEIVAIALSGQSYVRILTPVIAFGVCLTIMLVILTQLVIPRFVGMMASAMTADLPRLLTQSIKQHTPFVQGDLVIWAEDIYLDQDNQDERMVLEHVAVAKRDQRGEADMYLTASAALVDIDRVDTASSMYVMAKDATQWTRGEGNAGILRGAKKTNLNQGIELPSIAHARPSSLTLFELIALKGNERRFPEVNQAASSLQLALQKQAILESMSNLLDLRGEIGFTSKSGGRTFRLQANRITGQSLKGDLNLLVTNATGDQTELIPSSVRAIFETKDEGLVASVTLHMKKVLVGAGEGGENIRGELVIPNLTIDEIVFMHQDEQSVNDLLEKASEDEKGAVLSSSNRLKNSLNNMNNQILGRVNQRFALSLLPLLIVLLGSVMAIRNAMLPPLVVYSKVFGPAIIALLLVFAGGQMVRDNRIIQGFLIMWSGNLVVLAMILTHWLRLRKT